MAMAEHIGLYRSVLRRPISPRAGQGRNTALLTNLRAFGQATLRHAVFGCWSAAWPAASGSLRPEDSTARAGRESGFASSGIASVSPPARREGLDREALDPAWLARSRRGPREPAAATQDRGAERDERLATALDEERCLALSRR